MKRIEDTLFSKKLFIKTKDPLTLATKVLDMVSSYDDVKRTKNIYETDGPRKRVNLEFYIVENVDKSSEVRLIFTVLGEGNGEGFLEVSIKGVSKATTISGGFFSDNFSRFYTNELLPKGVHLAEKKIKDIAENIEKRLKEEKI